VATRPQRRSRYTCICLMSRQRFWMPWRNRDNLEIPTYFSRVAVSFICQMHTAVTCGPATCGVTAPRNPAADRRLLVLRGTNTLQETTVRSGWTADAIRREQMILGKETCYAGRVHGLIMNYRAVATIQDALVQLRSERATSPTAEQCCQVLVAVA
jgi:hypothetical protein